MTSALQAGLVGLRRGVRRRLQPTFTARKCTSSGKGDEPVSHHNVSIDRTGLLSYGDGEGTGGAAFRPHPTKPPPTPLTQQLGSLIKARGPITVAEYMKHALQHPAYGYYMTGQEKIGPSGDFITAPEISQCFGELLGVWCVATWQAMGSPSRVNLVEIGPGKGTLMADVLRSAAKFPAFHKAVSVHLVETSRALRDLQRAALGSGEMPIEWHDSLDEVPTAPLLVLAQELLDALPVHQFQLTERGWREQMVDINEGPTAHHLRFVLNGAPTPASRLLLQADKGYIDREILEQSKPGEKLEVCPAALSLACTVGQRVAQCGGGALFIDYGEDCAISDSVRAFKGHKEVPLLEEPGLADITADVDFAAMKRTAEDTSGVYAYGPLGQGAFLQGMGIETRVEYLMNLSSTTDELSEALFESYERLVAPYAMGTKYKVLALTDSKQSGPPAGFPPTG